MSDKKHIDHRQSTGTFQEGEHDDLRHTEDGVNALAAERATEAKKHKHPHERPPGSPPA
jgi:hypothetical protein